MEQGSGTLNANYKAPGGKLLRCSLTIKQDVIKGIRITGDFFMYPEEKIQELEKSLIGVSMDKGKIRDIVTEFYNTGGVQVIGAEPEDFVKLLMKAYGEKG